MATVSDINLNESTTVTARLAAAAVTRNSTVQLQEIMCIGDPDSTNSSAIAKVLNTAPASTAFGLGVRIISGPSSGADNLVKVVGNSTAADYIPVRIVDSSGTGFLAPGNEYTDGSTYSSLTGPALTYNNSSNNTMRQVGLTQPLPVQLRAGANNYNSVYSTVVSTASSAFYTLISSVASVRPAVYAYSVTSTAVGNVLVEFISDTVTTVWHTEVGSGSSGVTGANMALSPPGRLFQTTAVAIPILVRLGSTGVEVKISAAYFTE